MTQWQLVKLYLNEPWFFICIYIYFTSFGVLSELQPQNAALRQHATVHHDPMWSWWSPSCACQICTVCLGHPGVFQVPILCSVLRSLLGLETLKSDRQVCYGRHWPMLVRWFTGFKNGGLSCANCWFTRGYTRYPIISSLMWETQKYTEYQPLQYYHKWLVETFLKWQE